MLRAVIVSFYIVIITTTDGAVVQILAYCRRCHRFDPHTVQTVVCMTMSVLGLGVSMYGIQCDRGHTSNYTLAVR
jgi:hypothetical protein